MVTLGKRAVVLTLVLGSEKMVTLSGGSLDEAGYVSFVVGVVQDLLGCVVQCDWSQRIPCFEIILDQSASVLVRVAGEAEFYESV